MPARPAHGPHNSRSSQHLLISKTGCGTSAISCISAFSYNTIHRLTLVLPSALGVTSESATALSLRMSESTGHSGPGSSTTPTLATVLFDLALSFWRLVLRIFFRSIRPRGAWHIPSANSGTAVLFAGAPHHNQFLDPLLLSSEAFRASGRRVSFLTAEKSLRRKFIGPAARMMNSISVVRAADLAKPGIGRIVWSHGSDDDKLHITGLATRFRHQLEPRAQLVLPKTYGSAAAEVAEIISDTECILKRPFKDVPNKLPVNQALAPPSAETTRISVAEAEPLPHRTSNLSGTEFVVFPHIDHSRMYAQVFSKLNEGGSLGIFPEGVSITSSCRALPC